MSSQDADKHSRKLLLDEKGLVWFLDGYGMPKPTRFPACDFFSQHLENAPSRLRIIAWPRCTELILAGWKAVEEAKYDSLELCTPRCAPAWAHPQQALYCMRELDVPPSVGGWRSFTEQDEKVYRLVNCFLSPNIISSTDVAAALLVHPAWRPISFLANLNVAAVAKVLATTVDPRWHVDPGAPDRDDMLAKFLGLLPSYKSKSISDEEMADRRMLVMTCWKVGNPPRVPTSRQFVWSWWMAHGQDDLATSRFFVNFVRQAWLDSVYAWQELFVPEHFFATKAEADDFRQHMGMGPN